MSNTITAYFKGRIGVAESVYQNDHGIVMVFDSIELPAHFDCYFSAPGSDTAKAGVGADNRVVIPDEVLALSGTMVVHIPLHTGANDSEVEYVAYFKVIGRARPVDDGTPTQMTAVEQAIALLQQPITNIEEIVNEALSFTGETFDEMQEDLDEWKEGVEEGLDTWKGGVEDDIDDVEADFAILQGQFDTAVAALTVDSECADIRVGDDGVTYTSAGNAVRTQFADVKDVLKVNKMFTADTNIDGYKNKNITIAKIVPSKPIGNINYKLGLYAVGASGDNVLIAITKDCLGYASPNQDRLLARYYVAKSTVSNGYNTVTLTHDDRSGSDIDFYVTLDCTELKATTYAVNSSVYIDKDYLNLMYEIEGGILSNAEFGGYNHLSGISSVPPKFLRIFKCIKDISFDVPDSVASHTLRMKTFGYYAQYDRFYIQLYDVTDSSNECYAYASFDARPTKGVQKIEFEYYGGQRVAGGNYHYSVTIDWSQYEDDFFYIDQNTNSPIINANVQTLENNTGIMSGYFTLNSAITLRENQRLIGSECVVVCGSNAKITMAKGSSIENIKFVGSWEPSRTEGDGTTATSYGFEPLVSFADLSSGSTDVICGTDNTWDDALISIPRAASYNAKIDSCIFENFQKPVIRADAEQQKSNNNPIIANNFFTDCWCAIGVMGEFIRLHSNQYYRCIIGVYMHSSNCNQVGEIFKCCDCGIYFPTSSGAHNEITSVELAHCGLCSLYIKEINKNVGSQIIGCHIVDAAVVGESVNNLLINGCRLDTYFKYTSGQHNSIICSNIRTAYLYGNTLFDVPSDTQITLNRGMGTTADSTVNWE